MFHNTPHTATGVAPVELTLKRRVHTHQDLMRLSPGFDEAAAWI